MVFYIFFPNAGLEANSHVCIGDRVSLVEMRLEMTISIVLFIGPNNFSQVTSSEPKKEYNPQGAFLMKKVIKFIVYRTPCLF